MINNRKRTELQQKKMESKGFILLMFCILNFSGCKNIFENVDNYVETLSFQAGSYNIYAGEYVVCNLLAGPVDSFSYYIPVYSVEDSSVCEIRKTEPNSVVIYGKKEGSTLLVSKLGNKTAFAVVNVREKIVY